MCQTNWFIKSLKFLDAGQKIYFMFAEQMARLLGKYVFSLIYIFNRRQKGERLQNVRQRRKTTKCKRKCNWSFTTKRQFMRWINFTLYPNLLPFSCNVNKTTCVDEVDAKGHCKLMQQKKTWEKWIHFLSRLKVFMQAATKMLLDVNTPPTQLLCICLHLSCPAVNPRSSLTLSAVPTGIYSKPTNVDSNGELI